MFKRNWMTDDAGKRVRASITQADVDRWFKERARRGRAGLFWPLPDRPAWAVRVAEAFRRREFRARMARGRAIAGLVALVACGFAGIAGLTWGTGRIARWDFLAMAILGFVQWALVMCVWAVVREPRRISRMARRFARCGACGYDLSSLPGLARSDEVAGCVTCPECGAQWRRGSIPLPGQCECGASLECALPNADDHVCCARCGRQFLAVFSSSRFPDNI